MNMLADDRTLLRDLLSLHFAGEVRGLRPLPGGVFSRAFAFDAGGRAFVVRVSAYDHAAESYAKDAFAGRHFASAALPIPRVVATGRTDHGHFAISERLPGRTLAELPVDERAVLLPATLDTLDAVARTDVSASYGYGSWDADGVGEAASWHDYLAAVIENHAEGFYRDWHRLFRDSFLERGVYEAVYQHMLRLVPFCPKQRGLIHTDLQFENVLAEAGRITGVIDWGNAGFGDPLYDVARLAWWSTWPGWWFDDGAARLHERYGSAAHYAERVACYQCHMGLDDLRYYASTGQRDRYEQVRSRLLDLTTGR